MNGIIVIRIYDDGQHPSSSSSISSMCRICHEQENYESLEAPCSCSGTVKFAHRDCVQRWCDEKGDTTCEICMQKFEPGYTCPPPIKTQSPVTIIRSSLEVPRNDPEQGFIDSVEYYYDASEADDTTTSAASSVALVLTALLLVWHLFAVGEAETYPCSLLTVVIAKASGILVPMYILTRIVASLRKSIIRHRPHNNHYLSAEF